MNRRTACVWVGLVRLAVRRDLQFRSQVWLHLVASSGELAIGLLPALVLAGYDPATSRAAVLTVGVFAVTTGLMDCFVTPGLRRFDHAVRHGDLDLAPIRPVPTFWYAVLRRVEPTELGKCLTGTAILVAATLTYDLDVSPYAVLGTLVWAFVGMVAYCAFWANLAFLAFWLRSLEPVNDLAAAWRGAGQYPRRSFPRAFQVALVSFAPAALIGSYPAERLLEPATLALAPVLLVAACSLTAFTWRRGLLRYDSASS
ncbi:ABC transporter permease [Actinosynnema sp. NPDC091369]